MGRGTLVCGAGVVMAAERIQDSRALEILLMRNDLLLELAERLSAQLVGQRDFVSEHLRLDRAWLQTALALRTQQETQTRTLFEAGMLAEPDLLEAVHATTTANESLQRIDERLALGADFLLGRIDARACESRDLMDDSLFRKNKLTGDTTLVDALLARARQGEAAGLGSGDVVRLKADRDAVEVELRLIDLELKMPH